MVSVIGSVGSSRVVRGRTVAEAIDFDVYLTPHEHLQAGSEQGEVIVDDVVYTEYTSALIRNEGHLAFVPQTPQNTNPVYANKTPTICDVVDSHVNWLSDGTARIVCAGRMGSVEVTLPVSEEGGQTTQQFTRFNTNTFGESFSEPTDALLTPGKTLTYFSSYSGPLSWTIDPNCWANGLAGITSKSVYNNARSGAQNYWQPATLISRKHAVGAAHYNPEIPNGKTIYWVALDGTVHSRVVASQAIVAADTVMWTLDEELPADIASCLLLPSDWRSRFGYSFGVLGLQGQLYRLPPAAVLWSRQNFKVGILELFYQDLPNLLMSFTAPTIELREPFDILGEVATGDSGSPIWIKQASRFILASTLSSVDDLSQYLSAIDSAMGVGYSPEIADLSSFSTFAEP